MLAVLSMRLRQFTVQIENLSLKEVPGRLASYLIFLAEEQGKEDSVRLSISKNQLASLLGTIPETLSRIFSKMTDMKLIEVDGRNIKLLDRSGLSTSRRTRYYFFRPASSELKSLICPISSLMIASILSLPSFSGTASFMPR